MLFVSEPGPIGSGGDGERELDLKLEMTTILKIVMNESVGARRGTYYIPFVEGKKSRKK